jgi:NADP-dependent aldehyde dehydrogenase
MLTGMQLIGQKQNIGHDDLVIYGENPATGEKLLPGYPGASIDQVRQACKLASDAFDAYRAQPEEKRAIFLETCAEEIMLIGDQLIERAVTETGLPKARIEGERGRTCGQLKLFANVIRYGIHFDVRIDSAQPERVPLPRSDLRMQNIPLGPVAVFGASNFPLAFSVAGGDTASALAAGCPVIVKAHSAHPGTSELVGQAIQRAVKRCNLPEGVFSLIYGSGRTVGAELVQNLAISAVGFTGSRSGGEALMKLAFNRETPIPVYAEMSASNPVFIMPNALQNRSASIAKGFVSSLNMGAGQFCTNPGLVIACKGDALNDFIKTAELEINGTVAQTMLTSGIHAAYEEGINALKIHKFVDEIASGKQSFEKNCCQPKLFSTSAKSFLEDLNLQNEVFGASSLVVICDDLNECKKVALALEGQLTITIQLDKEDVNDVSTLMPILERKAGRILCNGFPTGVEVCHAMVHGGPYPSTSDSRTTSVGSSAINRFLRPVCYQDFPEELLPLSLKDSNPNQVPQLVDGKLNG